MLIRLAHKMTRDSIVDGSGIRAVIWTQGCLHNCVGCHNPRTHSKEGGFLMEIIDIIEELKELKLHKGVTFSGGEPFEQPLECLEIAKAIKTMGLDIWCYTGYVFEDLMNKNSSRYTNERVEFLKMIDVLVDGPFVLSKKNLLLKFRGSENQRILDVGKSLKYKMAKWKEEFVDDRVGKSQLA